MGGARGVVLTAELQNLARGTDVIFEGEGSTRGPRTTEHVDPVRISREGQGANGLPLLLVSSPATKVFKRGWGPSLPSCPPHSPLAGIKHEIRVGLHHDNPQSDEVGPILSPFSPKAQRG